LPIVAVISGFSSNNEESYVTNTLMEALHNGF